MAKRKHRARCQAHNELMNGPIEEPVAGYPVGVFAWSVSCNVNGKPPCKTVGTPGRKGERESAASVEARWKKEFAKK